MLSDDGVVGAADESEARGDGGYERWEPYAMGWTDGEHQAFGRGICVEGNRI